MEDKKFVIIGVDGNSYIYYVLQTVNELEWCLDVSDAKKFKDYVSCDSVTL